MELPKTPLPNFFGAPRKSVDSFFIGHFSKRNFRVHTNHTLTLTTSPFHGLWIALVTPFRDGAVDHPALHTLVTSLCKQGASGFVACGSTGEAAALSADEQIATLKTVRDAAQGLAVVMGVSGYHLADMVEWIEELNTHAKHNTPAEPIAGVLVPAPNYIRPSQSGLVQWFTAIADASAAPVIVYDIPYRTGMRIDTATLLALAGHPNIQAVKDCGGDVQKTQALINDGRLQVLAGEDTQIFSAMCLGAHGAISAGAHLHTRRIARVIALLEGGHLHLARELWQPIPGLMEVLFAEPNPALIKAFFAQQGRMTDELRAPMATATLGALRRLLEIDASIADQTTAPA